MTIDHDFKVRVRERMARTGERYTTARAHLLAGSVRRPTKGRADGRTPETAALALALGRRGAVAPHTGQPWTEAALFGLGGGIGMAYFTFSYAEGTTMFIGGRINEFVLGRDFMEAAAERAGAPATVLTTSGARTAEHQLRDALAAGHPVIALIDRTKLPASGIPGGLEGTMPYPVVITLAGDKPSVHDPYLGATYRPSWDNLAAARAAYRPGKHRLMVFDRPAERVELDSNVASAVADTVRGMFEPPRRNFGLPGFDRWAEALNSHGKHGWARLFGTGESLVDALSWLVFWIEGAGTAGGAYRLIFADFLDEVGQALGSASHRDAALAYRALAEEWSALASAVATDEVPAGTEASLRAELSQRVQALGAAETEAIGQLRST